MSAKEQMTGDVPVGQRNRAAIFSAGLNARKQLLDLLDIKQVLWRPGRWHSKPDFVLGWGRKANTRRARSYAAHHRLSYYSLEDGFLHSVGRQGVIGAEGVSVVVDKSGIYYDATTPSDLEKIIISGKADTPEYRQRARACMALILRYNISKYNAATVSLADVTLPLGKKVLVVDQTAGDMSLKYGYVNDRTFRIMLDAALREHPDAHIVVKTHVRVIAGRKKGCLSRLPRHERITLVDQNVNPLALIKSVDHVYVASSQMGFEALMAAKQVTCFGVPFYAQWGLTDDRGMVIPRRQKRCELEELFAAAYILYPRYIHPETGQECQLEDILENFIRQLGLYREEP